MDKQQEMLNSIPNSVSGDGKSFVASLKRYLKKISFDDEGNAKDDSVNIVYWDEEGL